MDWQSITDAWTDAPPDPAPTARNGCESKLELNPRPKFPTSIRFEALAVWLALLLAAWTPGIATAQTESKSSPATPPANAQAPAAAQGTDSTDDAAPLPGDWAPELLYGIWNSSNPDASEALYRAAFAAGPEVIPQLEAALKDDRTAEFAAQSLAYIGGNRALEILGGLMRDPRELGLKRFFYGALVEVDTQSLHQLAPTQARR